jgi:hypothetical protein
MFASSKPERGNCAKVVNEALGGDVTRSSQRMRVSIRPGHEGGSNGAPAFLFRLSRSFDITLIEEGKMKEIIHIQGVVITVAVPCHFLTRIEADEEA